MSSGFKFVLAALLLSVMALFFCPLAFGSFQSTHGPTSTLDSGAISIDLAVGFFGIALPAVVLEPLRRIEFESPAPFSPVSNSLHVRLCTFRC